MSNLLKIGLMIVAFNCFLGFAWLAPRTAFEDAIGRGGYIEKDMVAPTTIPMSSIERAVFYIYLACLPGLLLGKRIARVIFLSALFLMMLDAIFREGAWIFTEFSQLPAQFTSYPLEAIWGAASGVLWILWFAFNYWFFTLKTDGKRLLTFPIFK